MDKRFLLTLAAILAILGGLFWFTQTSKKSTPGTSNTNNTAGSSHTFGQNAKGVTLVEFGDLQCPACGQYYPIVKQIKEKYAADIQFQFRHFPLVQIHPNAMLASRAAEAAGKQNKFWEMHDMLYEQQQAWSSSSNPKQLFEDFATKLGLNLDTYRQDVSSEAVADIINADMKKGQAAEANSTPTFVLNGKKLEENPRDVEGFAKLIDAAIAEKSKK